VHEVPADAHDRLREGRDQIRTERLAGDQVQIGFKVVTSSSGTGGAPRSVPFGMSKLS